jgi:SpoVK/Ycf46/Vps4 family AAA+-type ATPase
LDDIAELKKLIKSGHHCISITTHEEEEALGIIRNVAFDLRRPMFVWSVGYGVREGLMAAMPAEPDTAEPNQGLCYMAAAKDDPICVMLDLGQHLKNELTLRVLRDTIERMGKDRKTLVMIDSCSDLPPVIRSYSTSFELSLPDEEEINELIRSTLSSINRKVPIETCITARGMRAIVRNLRGLTKRQARRIIFDTVADDRRFDDDDINRVIAGKRRMLKDEGLLEYIKTPLTMDEIGGMANLKKWLDRRKNAFKKDAAKFGIKPPRGVLMLGVQGAGKSLCAKAVATAWQQPLLRLDVGSLYNSYIGESERNLRKALKQAEFMAPVILWIDEIEKAFASAASQSSDGGLSKRMFGSLLTWMQEHNEPVFLIATANDIEALPPELLRKGRFDEIFFIGLPKKEARKKIFGIHLEKRKRSPDQFDLDSLAANSDGYTGAEIEQAVVSSLHIAFAEEGTLTTEMILGQLKESPPLSVTMAEKVQALYEWADGRCVSAD